MTPLDNCTLPGSPDTLAKAWCLYEHYVAGSPPERIYIGACPIRDLWTAPDARRNTEWNKVVKDDTPLLTRVIAIGTISECLNERAVMCKTNAPRCNLIGRDIATMRRYIKCSNGQTFATQQEAAETLGLNQSAISKVLRSVSGHNSVKGYTFKYEDAKS